MLYEQQIAEDLLCNPRCRNHTLGRNRGSWNHYLCEWIYMSVRIPFFGLFAILIIAAVLTICVISLLFPPYDSTTPITEVDTPRHNIRTWVDSETGVEYFVSYPRSGCAILLPRYDSNGEIMVHHNEV